MSNPYAPADDQSAPGGPAPTYPSSPQVATSAFAPQSAGTPVPLAFGRPGPLRGPGGVFLLCWVTLGVYALVTHYRLNDELRTFNPGVQVRPGRAVAAFFLPFGGLVSALHTSERIRRTQAAVGLPADCSGGMTFLCMLAGASFAYQQAKLNQVWVATGTH